VKKIVEAILPKLDNTTLSITEFPVGLESHVKQVVGLIEKHSGDVCMVGIWGMGGSGKTTVAKAIYNEIHRRFDYTSFIENIREVCEKDTKGHIHLQQQLLSDVRKTKEKIHSIALGTATIQRVLTGKKALVILDDVTDFQQIKALCGNHKFFGAGSVLIVTTRDVHILKLLKVDSVYKMEEMQKNESLELFSWHAFRKASPRGGFSELSRNVAAYCGGLPLALEVLGSYLFERTKQEWISVLSKLERIPNDQVHEKLRISYDGLKDDMVKDIFLDICCFFIGKDRAYVTEILNGCGLYADIGIAVLIDRSLLKVEKNNKLGMHDLIRDMGREIVRESSAREPGKRSRLWFHEDVHDVLAKNTVRIFSVFNFKLLIIPHNLINIINFCLFLFLFLFFIIYLLKIVGFIILVCFPYYIHYKCAWVLPFFVSLSSKQTKSISRYFPQVFFFTSHAGNRNR